MKKFYLLLHIVILIAFKTGIAANINLNSQFGPYCPTDTIAVNFNYDSYTAGNLVIFTAELSSTTGTFGTPTATNTISITIPTGGTGDTIVILTIAASPVFSNGYKVRVRTTSPNANVISNAFTINNPTVDAGTAQTICSNATAQLDATLGGGVSTASWTGGGTFSPNANTIDAVWSPSAAQITAGTATLILTTTGSCTPINDNVIITINLAATVDAGTPQTICSNSTLQLNGTIGGGATSGTWSGGGTFAPNANTIDPIWTPSAAQITAGTATLILTTNDPVGPCSSVNDNVVITINLAATVSAGVDQSVCAGTAVAMNGSFGGGATSATWSSNGTGSFNNGLMNAVYTPSALDISNGTVTITLTTNDPAGPCNSINDVMIITLSPGASVDAGIAQTICAGSTAQLDGTIGGIASSGTWSGGGTFAPSANTIDPTWTPSAAQITAGTATLTLTTNDPAGPCIAVSDNVVITINQLATVDAGPVQTICSNTTAQLDGTIGGGATSGSWTGGGTFSPNANTIDAIWTPSAAQITAGTATLTLTTNDPAGPCNSANDNLVITINPTATVDAGISQTICASSTASLDGTIGGSAISGTWTGGGTFSPNANTIDPVWTPSAAQILAGSATLTLTTNDPAGPCNAVNDIVLITINPIATVDAGPAQTICATSTAQLDGTIGGGATSGTWSGGGTFSPNANTLDAVWSPSAAQITAGTATLILATNDPAGPCGSANDNIVITINPPATVNAGTDQTICADGTALMNGSFGGSAASTTWSTSGNGTFNNSASLTAVYTPGTNDISNGTVTLILTTDNPAGPCNAVTDQLTLTILPLPVIEVTSISNEICSGDTTTLHVASTGTTQAITFNWQPAGLLNTSTGENVIASVTNTTASSITQTFTVIGSSSLGCTTSGDVTITINPLPNVPVINGKNSICTGEANVLYTIAPPVQLTDIFSWSATPAGINAFISTGNHDTCLADFSGIAGGVSSCNLFATVTTATFGCKSIGVKNISISGQAPPLEPVIKFSNNPFTLAVLYSQSGTNYRWGRDFISNFNQDTVGFNSEFGNQNLQLFLVPDTNATPLHFDQFYYWVEYFNTDINCKQKAYYNLDSTGMFQSLTGTQNKLIDTKNYFIIYPNPTNGIFTVQFNNAISNQNEQLFIYDLSGKQVENHLLNFNSSKLFFNVERKYPPGIYFVKYINQKGGCQISKIIIQ